MKKKEYPKGSVAIIDLDILAYRAAAACEQRSIEVTHLRTNKTKTFKTRTELKDLLKSKGKVYVEDDWHIVDVQTPESELTVQMLANGMLEGILRALSPEDEILLIDGGKNFRKDLPLPVKYKGSRKDVLRPVLLPAVREFLRKYKGAKLIEGCEVDDAVIYEGYNALRNGYKPIICTIDKDAWAYTDLWIWDFTKPEEDPWLIPKIGHLIRTGAKVKGCGLKWYAYQMLVGDPTDNYCPYELAAAKFGPAAACKILDELKDEKEILEVVAKQYKVWYPSSCTYKAWDGTEQTVDAMDYLSLMHKCVRMKETKDDPLNATKFYLERGVNLDDY